MNLNEILNNAEITLIEGESKSGKLTFALYSYSQNKKIEKLIILSSIPKNIMEKRIDYIKNLNNPLLNEILNHSKLLCLKENWLEIKISYNFDLIFEDIKRIILNSNSDAIILHRPDLMFTSEEYDYARIFIEKFIEISNNNGLKIFITSQKNHFITTFLENYTDISLIIEKSPNCREIKIKHSLYPINTNKYKFKFENNKFILEKYQKELDINNREYKKNILLISEDKKFIKINKYLFENKFNLTIASNLSDVIAKIEQKPDIIIYQDQNSNPEFTLCNTVKKLSPNSEIIFILNKDYIRIEDKMDAIQLGCCEILPKYFNLEEYILIIEKITHNFFYSKKIKFLPPQKIVTNYENFCKNIQSLYKENIFFSVIETNNFNKEIIKKLRNHDILFINEKNNYLYLCLINVTKEMFNLRLKEKLRLENYHFIEVIEWDGKC